MPHWPPEVLQSPALAFLHMTLFCWFLFGCIFWFKKVSLLVKPFLVTHERCLHVRLQMGWVHFAFCLYLPYDSCLQPILYGWLSSLTLCARCAFGLAYCKEVG